MVGCYLTLRIRLIRDDGRLWSAFWLEDSMSSRNEGGSVRRYRGVIASSRFLFNIL
jgi:hypothetical protein